VQVTVVPGRTEYATVTADQGQLQTGNDNAATKKDIWRSGLFGVMVALVVVGLQAVL
jgi:hypothetical protein